MNLGIKEWRIPFLQEWKKDNHQREMAKILKKRRKMMDPNRGTRMFGERK